MKEFLIQKRKAKGLTVRQMAVRCECSEALLWPLEVDDNWITHPLIAARIAKEYGLNVDEYNRLVHESHRAEKLPKPPKHKPDQKIYDAWRHGWGKKEGGKEE